MTVRATLGGEYVLWDELEDRTPLEVCHGATRTVLLTRRLAIKVPLLVDGWRGILRGMLANAQERDFASAEWPELCPILFSLPFGLLVVMPRCQQISSNLPRQFWDHFINNNPHYVVPVERKIDSIGWHRGRIVAIDYGS